MSKKTITALAASIVLAVMLCAGCGSSDKAGSASEPAAAPAEEMDIQLHYAEYGSGEPLILLHGNSDSGAYFVNQVPYFEKDYRVIALDTRGHGESPRGTAPFTLEQFAADLESFMDEQGIDKANLLGFSDGGNIALLFALSHPERVNALVIDGANLYPDGIDDEVHAQIDDAYDMAQSMGDEQSLEFLRLMAEEPSIDPAQLASLDMPVLVIAGTDDMIKEEHTRLIADSIPGAQLAIIEGTHFVAYENPDEFNRVVGEFLREYA